MGSYNQVHTNWQNNQLLMFVKSRNTLADAVLYWLRQLLYFLWCCSRYVIIVFRYILRKNTHKLPKRTCCQHQEGSAHSLDISWKAEEDQKRWCLTACYHGICFNNDWLHMRQKVWTNKIINVMIGCKGNRRREQKR